MYVFSCPQINAKLINLLQPSARRDKNRTIRDLFELMSFMDFFLISFVLPQHCSRDSWPPDRQQISKINTDFACKISCRCVYASVNKFNALLFLIRERGEKGEKKVSLQK